MKRLLIFIFIFCGIGSAFAMEEANRLELSLGAYFPIGKYKEPDGGLKLNYFPVGASGGFSYTRFLTENVGVGAFLDDYYIITNSKNMGAISSSHTKDVKLNFSADTSVLGGLIRLETDAAENWKVFGLVKAGLAITGFDWTYRAEGEKTNVVKDYAANLMLGAAAGFRYFISGNFDVGLFAQYTYLNQKAEDDNDKKFKLDLSGPSVSAALGYRF